LLGSHGLTADVSVAGVIGPESVAIAISRATARIACRTGDTIAHRTRHASTGLTTLADLTTTAALASAGLTALAGLITLAPTALLPWLAILRLLPTRLTSLTGLPVAAELTGPELLATGLAGLTLPTLTLPGLRVRTSAETGELIAQTG